MKFKGIIVLSLLLLAFNVFGQNDSKPTTGNFTQTKILNGSDNNELRINLVMSIAGLPELTYERFVADNMGIGLSGSISLDNTLTTTSIILPYYRVYFGSAKASGFFIEGNMALVNQKQNSSYDYYNTSTYLQKSTNFGLGAAIGVKLLTRNGFLGEVYLGAGRLFGESIDGSYPRVGICLGKRF